MKIALILGLSLALGSIVADAQTPYIVGTWKLNPAASRLPGPMPQTQIRRYSLAEDGTLIGLTVVIDAQGIPNFLQFAAKADGKDYGEFDSGSLARFPYRGRKERYRETVTFLLVFDKQLEPQQR